MGVTDLSWPTVKAWPRITDQYMTDPQWASEWWTCLMSTDWYKTCPMIEIKFAKSEMHYDSKTGLIYKDSLTWIKYGEITHSLRTRYQRNRDYTVGLYVKQLMLGGEPVVLMGVYPNAWLSDDGWHVDDHARSLNEFVTDVKTPVMELIWSMFPNQRIIEFMHIKENVFYFQKDGPDILLIDHKGKIHGAAMFWDENISNSSGIGMNIGWDDLTMKRFLLPKSYYDSAGHWVDSAQEYLSREHRLQNFQP